MPARTFLRTKILALAARARRLARIDRGSVGIRPQDVPYAPSPAHFAAANERLGVIGRQIERRLRKLQQSWNKLQQSWKQSPLDRVLVDIALVERELDRARRTFGLFFEMFSQRGTTFAPALAAYDVVAQDCYTAVREAAPRLFRGPLLTPLCYKEHGYSPATMRRGVLLNRLLGEPNPFPIVRIPWDRDNPWQAVFLHEVAHNLQADLGIWQENRQAVVRRTLRASADPNITRIYGRWHTAHTLQGHPAGPGDQPGGQGPAVLAIRTVAAYGPAGSHLVRCRIAASQGRCRSRSA